MTSKAPSNPSPFSAELQTFIVTKYDPLLLIVQELNERFQASEKERFRQERRVQRLEHHLFSIKTALAEGRMPPDQFHDEGDLLKEVSAVKELLEDEEALVAPWLFSCQPSTPTSALQVLLEFSPDKTEELDVSAWKREEDMWINFLEDQPFETDPIKADTLKLADLRKAARRALLDMCRCEILMILRNVPGKDKAQSSPTTLTLVAIMAAAFSEAWSRVESEKPDSLGRVALILEGQNIGARLRAGKKRFHIEPLN